MSVSLNTAVIGAYQQILPQVLTWLDKAEAHCAETGGDAEKLAECRLFEDMWPFAKQVHECVHHSAGAIEGVHSGLFGPDPAPVAPDYAEMRAAITGALAVVNAVGPDELDAIAGRDMLFKVGTYEVPFTVGDFLLSFSLPNFYFHATTAYGLLRSNGVKIGKMDFLGKMRARAA